jgi:hypothetical protein
MTVGKSAKSDQRMPHDKAAEYARKDKAPDLKGAGGPQDSEVIQSAVAALGAPVAAAGVDEKEELERVRQRGLLREGDGLTDDGLTDDALTGSARTDNQLKDEIPGVSGRQPGRAAPANPTRSADELERNYREDRPGEASARQAGPNAAPTPLQRLHEDG